MSSQRPGAGFGPGGFLPAVSMFTVIPVPARALGSWPRTATVRVIAWLPVIGAVIGGLAGLLAVAVREARPSAATLAATIGVLALAGLSGGLHLDGLADTSDGLASRTPADQALEIMRRSDIGPFGVLAIVAALLIDVTALSAVIAGHPPWRALAALTVAAATARLTAVHASRPGVPAARPGGFGAMVTGTAPTRDAIGLTALTLGFGAGVAAATGASVLGWVLSQIGALALAGAAQHLLVRRLGGMTGDVYGALIELALALTLVGFALS